MPRGTWCPPVSSIGVEGDAHFFSPRGYLALAQRPARESAGRLCRAGELGAAGQVAARGGAAADRRSDRRARDANRAANNVRPAVGSATWSPRSWPPRRSAPRPWRRLSGPRAACCRPATHAGTPHLTWSDRPFRIGEATTIELAGVFGRYHAPLARTVMLGDPPQRLTDTATRSGRGDGGDVGCDPPRRHRRCRARAFDRVIRSHGLRKESRIGYSIGIGYPPGLGRAHREPAARGDDRVGGWYGVPHHPRNVDGRLGLRTVRADRGHRYRAWNASPTCRMN